MASLNPWLNSTDLVDAFKRKASFSPNDETYDDQDILNFIYDEMLDSLVPEIMSFNSDYYVKKQSSILKPTKLRYPILSRAMGMKLRDLFFLDDNNNEFEMHQIAPDDRSAYQNFSVESNVYTYYFENNDIVLTGTKLSNPTGYLNFSFYIRPNKLVPVSRAAIVQFFTWELTCASVVAGDTFTIDDQIFTAVSGTPSSNQFEIGGTDTITATNLASAINSNGIASATSSSAVVTIHYTDNDFTFSSSNSTRLALDSKRGIQFDSVPSHIVGGSTVDLLQTKSGHSILNYDIVLSANAVSGNTIKFATTEVPDGIIIGDYMCSANECIIPFVPTEFHSNLVDRAARSMMNSIGDSDAVKRLDKKLDDVNKNQEVYVTNRAEGSPKKIFNRHSILRYQKYSPFRRRI